MGERELGLLLVAGITLLAWVLGRYWKQGTGAAVLLAFGLVLLTDDYFGGPFPWRWGAAGAAMLGIGISRLWYLRLAPGIDASSRSRT